MAEIAIIQTKTMRQVWTSLCLQTSSMTVDFKLNPGKAFDLTKLKKEADCVNTLGKLIVDMIQSSRPVTVSGMENFHVEAIGECRQFCAAVDSFTVAQQMLVADDVGTVILLLRRATLLQDAIIQMVSSVADSEVKFISLCIKNIRELLCSICSTKDLRDLEGLIKEYSDAVSQLKSCVIDGNMLIHDTLDIPDVNSAVDKLIKSTSMLTISIESVLKYPDVEAAETNKNSVFGFIQSCLNHLSIALNQQRSLFNLSWTDPLKLYENEQFTTVCAKIVDLLKTIILIQRTGVDELEMLVNFCIQYAMNLAEKLQDDCQNSVFEACNEIIMSQRRISQICHNTSLIVLSEDELKQNDLKNLVQLMINSLESMKKMVFHASLYLAVGMIAGDCSIPALNLLSSFKEFRVSIAEDKNHVMFSKSNPEYFVNVFEQHLKTTSEEWKIVIFGSLGTLKDIQEVRRYLVENEIVGKSIVSLAKELIKSNLYNSPAHFDQLTKICDEWCSRVHSLPSIIDRIFNSTKMLFVCGDIIMKLVSKHQHSAAASNSLNGMAILNGRCFCKLAAKVMDQSVDAHARRNLRRKIAVLEQELNLGGNTNHNNAALGLKCSYQMLWRATYDICCCVETGDFKEKSTEVINVALKSLVFHAVSGSNTTVFRASEANFYFLTSLGIHGSAAAEITAIVSRLIFHTISNSLKAETASEQLLSASTHLLHSSLLVIDTIEKKERRHFVLEKLSQLTDLVPSLLEEAKQVKHCKNYDLKLFYEMGEKCCHTMCFLVDYINGILNRWNPIPKNLVSAALAHDSGWLKKEMVELSSQMLSFKELTAFMTKESFLFDDNNMETLTGCEDVEAFIKEIESIYDRILYLTDRMNSSGQDEDDIVSQIRFLSRDWSAKLFFLISRIDRMDRNESASSRSGNDYIQRMTQEAADLRREIYMRFQMHSSSETEEIYKCLDDLEIILKKVKDVSQTSKDLFASQKLCFFSSLWKSKVRKLRVLIEKNSTLAVEVNSESSSTQSDVSYLEKKICISDKIDSKRLATNIEDYRINVKIAKPPELSSKETVKKKSVEEEFIRPKKDQLTAEAIFHKGNHQTHLPCDSEYKISSPVVDGIIANGSILDSIDEMADTANQLLADVQSDEKNVGNTQDQKTDLLQVLQVNEKKMLHTSTALLTNCNDTRIREELSCTVEGIRSTLMQIYILIGVKSAVHDRNADDANIKTVIGRLLNLLTKLKSNFKAACVRGFNQSTLHSVGDRDACELAEQWKIRWMKISNRNSLQAQKDRFGLRTITAVPK